MLNNSQFSLRTVVNNLIAINVVVFLAQMIIPGMDAKIVEYFGLHFWESKYFMPHQVITYMFVHDGFSHLFFNMFALWMFGRILEYDLGGKRFLTYYMITGIGAGLLNLGVNWIEFSNLHATYGYADPNLIMHINRTVTVGASGAVFGVLLAFGMIHPNDRIMLLIPPIPLKAKYFVIIYGVLELAMGFTANDNIAHFAHIGGMLFGFILLYYWKKTNKISY